MTAPAWRIRRTLRPDLAAVDLLCAHVRNRLKGSASAADSFAVELLLREALVNAVKHGCRGRPGGHISCEVRRSDRGLRMSVCDDGRGFDWQRQQQSPAADLATSGRGVSLYSLYADRVTFNGAGNRVVLFRRLHDAAPERP